MKKRLFIALLAALMSLALLACCALAEPESFVGEAQGYNGNVRISVTLDGEHIDRIDLLEHSETVGVGARALNTLADRVVDEQAITRDVVSGATVSSRAFYAALDDALAAAGVSADQFASEGAPSQGENGELRCDVLVVGGGGSGLAAAISARKQGADVLLIEKTGMCLGSTGLSAGSLLAAETRVQDLYGIKDSKMDLYTLWTQRQHMVEKYSPYPDEVRLASLIDEATETISWLASETGYVFRKPEGWSVDTVLRLHYAGGAGGAYDGSVLVNHLYNYAVSQGVNILLETKGERILLEDGKVAGVMASNKNGELPIYADSVVIATGGFASSQELMERFIPDMAGFVDMSVANAACQGEGILMMEEIGAALYEDPWVIGLRGGARVSDPDTGVYAKSVTDFARDSSSIYIDATGHRFMNEYLHYSYVTMQLLEHQPAFMLLDSSIADYVNVMERYITTSPDQIYKADTLGELGKLMGFADDFEDYIAAYNAGCASGEDEFGKAPSMLRAIDQGPFYAVRFYPAYMGTFGGVKTDERFQVLDTDGEPIANLYAGGECANRVYYDRIYMTGSAVQIAVTSGRIAGEAAALNALK